MAVPGLTLYHLKSHLQVRPRRAADRRQILTLLIASSARPEFWLLLLLQKYRLAVSRGLITASPGDNGEGSNDWSSSSENEYDEDTAAELRSAFAADDHGAVAKEGPCDSSRSVARMQREVQRKMQEQIEVNDRPVNIPSF
jgi:hypothetical protein